MQMADGGLVAQALRSDALGDDCARASLIVSARQPPTSCAAPVIDRERLQRQGGLALRRTPGGFSIDAVRPGGAERPWAPTTAGGPEPDMVLGSRPTPPRAPDATPSDADLQADE
jgi:competence protein ComEC